ncbi:MAG: CHRD domain-containing protein [Pirellulales bacterium]
MRTLLTIIVASVTLLVSSVVSAQTVFTANITNSQEPGNIMPTTSAGAPRTSSGTATFTLSPAMDSLSFTATVVGIDFTGAQTPTEPNDNLAAAHIHASSDPLFMPPTNAGVVWGFFGAPFNETAPNDQVITLLPAGAGATISGKWDLTEGNGTTLTAQLPNIFAGRAYINFHTAQFPGGEIRGAIIPEPSTIALIGFGFVALGMMVRKRRAKNS